MLEITNEILIYFSNELALTCQHLDQCSRTRDFLGVKSARRVLAVNLIEFQDVFEKYKKSKVVSPVLIEKSERIIDFATMILRLSSKVLQEELKVLQT